MQILEIFVSSCSSLKMAWQNILKLARGFQDITLVEQLVYFIGANQLFMLLNSFMRPRYCAANF